MFRKKYRTFLKLRNFRHSKVVLAASLLLLTLPLFVSCNTANEFNSSTEEGEGLIYFLGAGVDDEILDAQTKASTRITTEDLKVRIENTKAEVLKEWDSVDDVPEIISAVAGSYKIVAYSGDETLLPSFTEQYYTGETKFAVVESEQTDVSVVVKHGSTKVSVVFDTESFESSYSSYSIDLKTTPTDGSTSESTIEYLTYLPETTDEGSFMPGTLSMRLLLTPIGSDEQYVFYPEAIAGLEAAERRTLNFKVVSTTGTTELQITTDDGYSYTEEIVLELPSSILPKAAPTIDPYNFEAGEIIEGNESLIPETGYSASILAPAGVKSVKIRSTTPEVVSMWGGASQLEVVDASTEISNILSSMGFRWDSAISSSSTANVKYSRFYISFGDLFGYLTADTEVGYTDYEFEIEVVDMYDQSNKNSSNDAGKFSIYLRVYAPLFGWSVAPTEGNVWSSHAEFDIYSYSSTTSRPTIWYKEAEGEWRKAENQSFEGDTDDDYQVGVQTITGLSSETQYSFRLAMGEHITDELTATTEAILGVENGDMEDWTATQLGTSLHNIPYYTPYTSSGYQYWTTNNDRTTAYRQFACTYGYNSFPTVSYTLMAYNGTFAAEVRSISASDIHVLNTTSITYDHSKTSGKLFVGTFSYDDGNDYITLGKPYESRPKSFSFYHTYTPYDSNDAFTADIIVYNGDTEIGRGAYVSKGGATISNYTLQSVDIEYTDRRTRATQMSIYFTSTNQDPAPVRKTSYDVDFIGEEDYNEGWGIWLGAILRLDDIEVQY
ncbi:MAG: DUF4493 domain-containing protein [Rikenellaceae bacterium]